MQASITGQGALLSLDASIDPYPILELLTVLPPKSPVGGMDAHLCSQ